SSASGGRGARSAGRGGSEGAADTSSPIAGDAGRRPPAL
ncbi:MAG: hypothetical protein JWR86_1415, partial [Enterovirga sp.]|nr:hypothetical protein [Enterovirga sp.]